MVEEVDLATVIQLPDLARERRFRGLLALADDYSDWCRGVDHHGICLAYAELIDPGHSVDEGWLVLRVQRDKVLAFHLRGTHSRGRLGPGG